MSISIANLYGFAIQQMASEAYFDGVDYQDPDQIAVALRAGNNRQGFSERGFSRFTTVQIAEFRSKFAILHQASDNPNLPGTVPGVLRTGPAYYDGTSILANTGLSATLIQNKVTGEFTLSIRSTEFRTTDDGGDRARDVFGADINGIGATGFALAQLSALEDYYSWLKTTPDMLPSGAKLNVTGYSLGGHLATVFTEMHASDTDIQFQNAFTFNGAGRGRLGTATNPGDIVSFYRAVLADRLFELLIAGVPRAYP